MVKMVKRELYLKEIRPFYESEMVKVITGIRRCGKSTLLRQIMDEIRTDGVPEERILYMNFEDYKYKAYCEPGAFYEYVESKLIRQEKHYLFFDEIQNVNEFELVVNSFRATHDVSIFITGSNSRLLSGELATHLSGRTVSFRILPFNFKEFCQFHGERADYDQLLAEYMRWGGFPLVCKEKEERSKEILLSNIYDSAVLKDIVMRNKVTSPQALERVLDYLVGNSSVTVSGNKISEAISDKYQKVSAPTVYNYIKYVEEACICDKVPRYDIRGKKQLAFEEKVYVCDLGFFYLKKNRVKDEYNYIVETICYNELITRGYKVYVGKIYRGEVDFIAQRGQEKIYVQAAYYLADEAVAEREFGAYRAIEDNYPKYVVSMDKVTLGRDGIIHKNLIDFLLER